MILALIFFACYTLIFVLFWNLLFFSRPWSEGCLHHGRTFSICLCPLSFWLTLLRGVLSTSWCCPSRPCVVFLACVHLALFLALSLSPDNSLVSSWCDHSMLVSLLWVFNSSLFTPALLRTHSFVFFAVHETHRIFVSPQTGVSLCLYIQYRWIFRAYCNGLSLSRVAYYFMTRACSNILVLHKSTLIVIIFSTFKATVSAGFQALFSGCWANEWMNK